MKLLSAIGSALLLVLASCEGEKIMGIQTSYEQEALQLAKEIFIVDTHIDLPYRLTSKKLEDVSKRTKLGEFDYPRAKEGGLNAAFMALYVPPKYQDLGGAAQIASELIDLVERLETQWPEQFAVARSPGDLQRNFERGIISLPLGIENGAAIEDKLTNLERFFARGVRYVTLVHGTNNQICDSSYDKNRKWNGLSPFGREVVVEMNHLGMIVDISHVSDDSFYDVLEVSKAPVMASHSSCRHFTPGWERNMEDEMIKRLSQKGGVIQINFGSMFLTHEYRNASRRIQEFLDEKGVEWDSPEATELIAEMREKNPPPDVTVMDVVAHIDHVVELVGIDHVGLGSDFDGVGGELPAGLEDVSCYPNLIRELLRKGYSEEDIGKICSANFLRVWSEVDRVALQGK